MNTSSDQLYRFLFDDTDIRGEIVSVSHSLQEMLAIQQYPAPIAKLLGEFVAAAALLSSTLKFAGSLSLQARGNGDITLMMAEVSHQKKVRGVAQINEDAQFEDRSLTELLNQGMLSIVIDPDKGERYQGIVALEGNHLAQCLEGYFLQSEQLPTRIWLSSNGQQAGGILLQRLPTQIASQEKNDDTWETQVHLTSTTSEDELLNLPRLTLLNRLFHEADIRVFEPEAIHFACSCSKKRSDKALERLDKSELLDIIREEGQITVDCHFCGFKYIYLNSDIEQLFSSETRH